MARRGLDPAQPEAVAARGAVVAWRSRLPGRLGYSGCWFPAIKAPI